MPHNFPRKPKPVIVHVKKVMCIYFLPPDPTTPTSMRIRPEVQMTVDERKGWLDPVRLAQEFSESMRFLSNGTAIYHVRKSFVVEEFPMLEGGSQYNIHTYNAALADSANAIRYTDGSGSGLLMADYERILDQFKIVELVNAGIIDEVWMFGGPYFGFYESRLVGRNAYYVNGPGIEKDCPHFVMMGFNYERELDQMLHSYGHRSEFMLSEAFQARGFLNSAYQEATVIGLKDLADDDFENWVADHGTVHTAPGCRGHYEYGEQGHDTYIRKWLGALPPEFWQVVR